MDISFLMDYINVVVLGICLCVGYVVKYSLDWIDNKYIPLLMLIVGTTTNCLMNIPNLNMIVVLGGMISGLASTGLYEAMRNLLDKDGSKGDN